MGIMNPYLYIGKVTRDENGVVRNIEVFYDKDNIHLNNGDEFITFETKIFLETTPE